MIGKTLLHYEILRELGAGGMGEVYLARDTRLGREVAVKVLPAQLCSDAGRLERFRREASIVAALNHPNIVTVHSVEEADGLHFFTMEFVDGHTLSRAVPGGGLPLDELLGLAVPLTDALAAAHARGVTHRDLKPGNVMVTSDGRLKVLDFGLAKAQGGPRPAVPRDSLADTEFLTGDGQILGTTPYMAPEQLKGRPADSRSDVFALGTILYIMATGDHPFQADSSAEIISSILGHAPPSVDRVRPHLPDGLGRIIDRCLEKDPERRYRSAADLRQALEDLARDPQQAPSSPTVVAEPGRPRPGSRSLARAGAAAAVVLAVIAAWLAVRGTTARPLPDLPSVAVLPFANLTGDPELDRLAEAISADLIGAMAELEGLRVASRSEAWGREDRTPSGLLRELGVGSVVDGEIRRGAPGLRQTVSLTDTATGFVLWSHTYATTDDRAFGSQRAMARDLATYLSIPHDEDRRRRLASGDDGTRQAFAAYVAGRRFLDATGDPKAPAAAAENFRQALRIAPDFVLARVGLSEALWQAYHFDGDSRTLVEAEREAREALRLDPELPAAQVALARAHRGSGRHAESIRELEEVLARHPRPDVAQRELADSYERVGDLEEAEKALRAAVALRPGEWSNWNWLGTFLTRHGRYEEAEAAHQRALEVAPDGVSRPAEQLATINLAMGRFDEAIEAYERIPRADRGPGVASNLGTAYFFSDRPDKWDRAEASYLQAVRLNPRDAVLHRNLGDLYAAVGRHDEARRSYLEARALVEARLEADPDDPDLLLELADTSAKGGDCETALDLAADLRRLLTDTGPNAHMLAYIFATCGDGDRALAAIARAVELGQSPELIRQEEEFRGLRSRPDFIALVGGG